MEQPLLIENVQHQVSELEPGKIPVVAEHNQQVLLVWLPYKHGVVTEIGAGMVNDPVFFRLTEKEPVYHPSITVTSIPVVIICICLKAFLYLFLWQ